MKRVADILLDLVAIPSVSSMSNQAVVEYALSHLEPALWNITVHPYCDDSGITKVNLVAITKHGRGKTAELALVCHTDTVPFDAAWKDAVTPAVRNGKLYGRGSCDVKGFLACVLASLAQVDLTRLSKPLALVLTADEEIGCVGAKYLARKKAIRSRYTIVGEPTGLRPVCAGKGYALAEIVITGEEAHSAFPARGRSAIYDAARVVARLERIARKIASRKNPDFDPPFTTINAGLIRGGSAKNIVPGECRITVEWRPIPGQDPQWVLDLIREELSQLRRRFPRFQARINVKRLEPAFEPANTRDLARLLESLTHHRATTVPFGTEAPHFSGPSSETVVFGPGDMTVAHKTGEFVPTAELHACVAHLKAAIEQLCGG